MKSLNIKILFILNSLFLVVFVQAQRPYVSPEYSEYKPTISATDYYEIHNLSYRLGDHPVHSGPRISIDGSQLFYFVDKHDQTALQNIEPLYGVNQDIYQINFHEEEWGHPQEIHELNNLSHNGVHFISHDNSRLILLGEYKPQGISENGLSVAHFNHDEDGWNYPERIHVKKYKNSNISSYTMSSDESVMLLALDGKISMGEQDIFVSFREGKKWGSPINLGDVVNTENSEGTMFLAPDNKTLYFSSNGHEHSFGGYDVYKTIRLDDSWTKWSEPMNLGQPFNGEFNDLYYTYSRALDASLVARSYEDNNGISHSDILMIKEKEVDVPKIFELIVNVYDSETNEPLNAYQELKFEGQLLGVIEEQSSWKFLLEETGGYSLLIDHPAYVSSSKFVNLEKDEDSKSINVYLNPKREQYSWEIENVNFEFDSDVLVESSYTALEEVRDILKREQNLIVEISGHTDSRGDDSYNQELSQKRANAIVNYLVEAGVPKSTLIGAGYGERQLINQCDDGVFCEESSHLDNRRVEFKILKVIE